MLAKESKDDLKYILIIVIVGIVVGVGIFWYLGIPKPESEPLQTLEEPDERVVELLRLVKVHLESQDYPALVLVYEELVENSTHDIGFN